MEADQKIMKNEPMLLKDDIETKKGLKLYLRWHDAVWCVCIGVLFSASLELYYRMINNYKGNYPSDFPYYAKLVTTNGEKHDRFVEMLSQQLYNINHNTMEFNIYASSVVVLIAAVNYVVITYYVKHDRLSNDVPRYARQAASIAALFVGPIYLHYYHQWFHKGSFASFAWHSPTQQTMTLFSLVATLCLLKMIDDYQNGISVKWWLATSATVFLSAFTKPSFVISLVPSVVVLFTIELIAGGREDIWQRLYRLVIMGCSLLPAGIYILLLNALEFGDTTLNGGSYYVRFGIEVFREKNNVMSMFVFGMAFSIVVIAVNYKRLKEKKYALPLQVFFFGVMQWALLAESGARARHGNFSWGRVYGCYYLNLISLTILLENIYCPDSVLPNNKNARRVYLVIAIFLLLVSVLCQMNYFTTMLAGWGYWR